MGLGSPGAHISQNLKFCGKLGLGLPRALISQNLGFCEKWCWGSPGSHISQNLRFCEKSGLALPMAPYFINPPARQLPYFAVRGRVHFRKMVPRGLEPRPLRLLAVRSNQLSYETRCLLISAAIILETFILVVFLHQTSKRKRSTFQAGVRLTGYLKS